MAATAADARREHVRGLLTYSTPFWAGGARKTDTGAWLLPGPGEFQGCAKILNKRQQLVPAIPHPWQLEFDDKLEAQRAAGLPMRAIVLKARKLGFSTWVALKFLQRLTMLDFQTAIIVAQDVKTANVIFQMALLCHAHLPTVEELGMGFNIRPPILKQNFSANGRTFVRFGEASERLRANGRGGDSVLEIDTAGSPDAGRGTTPSMVHFSEIAWYETQNAVRKMTGLLNAVPYEPETIVIQESTANGLNHFYKRWIAARDGANDPESGESYVSMFVPWWRDASAARAFATIEDRERFRAGIGDTGRFGELADDEPMLVELYDCTPEQLLWRRMMIRGQHADSVELFNQENPHSDEAAFIGSGRTVFGGILVARAIKQAEEAPAPVEGTLQETEWRQQKSRAGTLNVPQAVRWVPEPARGEHVLRVWEHPVVQPAEGWPVDLPEEDRIDGAYMVAVDVALGEANTFTQGDFHAVQVFDHRTHAQVAAHHSRMPLERLPAWVLRIALYYNRAWIIPEVNGPGIYVVDALVKSYRYSRVYRRKRRDHVTEKTEERPGWETNARTKQLLEGGFADELQTGGVVLRDQATARELNTYVVTDKGKHEAQEGEHDDLLMAAMIACRGMEELRPPRKRTGGRRRPTPHDPLTGY